RAGAGAALLRGPSADAGPGHARRRPRAAGRGGRVRGSAGGGIVTDNGRWPALTSLQQVGLILLRTLIGWHFFYEGYFKLWRPAWTRSGAVLGPWSSAGSLRVANGPFADVFHRLAASSSLPTIDHVVSIALLLVGLSLMLGLFTQAGCVGALALLAMFYLSF